MQSGITALTYLIYYLKSPWLERCTRAAKGHAYPEKTL